MKRRFSLFLPCWFLVVAFNVPGFGLQVTSLEDFTDAHPGIRFYGTPFYNTVDSNDEANSFGAVYGTVLGVGATPLESAAFHLGQIEPLLGTEWGELTPVVQDIGDVLLPVMPQAGTEEPRFYALRYDQHFEGLPVFRSGVGLLIRNEPGNPVVVSGIDIKNLPGFHVGSVGPENVQVTQAMLDNVAQFLAAGGEPEMKSVLKRSGMPGTVVSDERMVIFAGADGATADPQVAVEFIAERGSVRTYPDYSKYRFVAALSSGELLLAENQILDVNITGTVQGRATNGIGSLECHPEVAVGLPFAEATVTGGNTVFANAAGAFTIPHGGSAAVNVRSRLRGQWFEVFDQSAGGAIPELNQTVTPPGPANFLHNPVNNQQFPTANVNAYLEANVVRTFVLNYQPTFPVIGTQTFFDINTNINDSCNAFYNGSSINFFRAAGGCNNTAFSDIIYHEYGHHLVSVTGNGQGQFGEGSGDVMGVLIQDEPILGHGFGGNCSAGFRTANNNLQYPCNGAIHTCGQLISGAVWETRKELAITEPSSYRDINASLYLGMMIVRGQMVPGDSTIDPFITVLYLELDDDDSDIGNGTPHYNEIATGFGDHNLDAPPLRAFDFEYPNGRPELVPHVGGPAFTVEVVPIGSNPQPGTGILHVDRGNGFETFAMNQLSPNVYQAIFPSSDCARVLRYYVSAGIVGGGSQTDPIDAPAVNYSAIAGTSLSIAFSDNFQTNLGWTVSPGTPPATDGQWNRGVPVGGGDRGDPPTDGDGSGQCYLTDNVDGNSDVDGGVTRLTSPTLNATTGPGQFAVLSYMRWYSNNSGSAPEEDVFVVEISNNNGASWTNLETVGPTGPEVGGGWITRTFRISDVIAPTNQMRLRFNASDLANGSVVEAAVDAVSVKIVTCENPTVAEGRKLLDGFVGGGQLSDANSSNNQYFKLNPSPTSNLAKQKIDMILQSTSPLATPGSMRFRMESKKIGGPVGDVIQSLRLLNYQTNQYETVDVRAITNTDAVVNLLVTGNPARFVQAGTREITADVIWESPGFSGAPFTWTIDLDEAVWIIE